MAQKGKMTQAKLDELRDAYNAWQPYAPDSISADELAAQFGISKQTMYHWRRKDFKIDGRDVMKGREKAADNSMADVVAYLVEQVTALKVENHVLQDVADRVQATQQENERLRALLEGAVNEQRSGTGATSRADHLEGASPG